MIPFALMAAGTALQVVGAYNANVAQAKAEIMNADYYDKQASFALAAQFRQESLANHEYEMRKGAQIGAYAKGGVDLAGSASTNIAETLSQKVEELTAIKRKGDLEFSLANSRGLQSRGQADTLTSFQYNGTQAASTILTNVARATDNNPNSAMGQFLTKHLGS
jgi:hypothetical protein